MSVNREVELQVKVENDQLYLKKSCEAVAIFLFEGKLPGKGMVPVIDKAASGLIRQIWKEEDFEGKLHQTAVLYPRGGADIRRVILIGLGKRAEFSADKMRSAGAKAGQTARSLKVKSLAVALDADELGLSWEIAAEANIEGTILGLYQFTDFKTLDRETISEVELLCILIQDNKIIPLVKKAAERAEKICRAVYLTRNMVSAPANEMTPTIMAREALNIAKGHKKIKTTILDAADMKRLGMNALLGVARGSEEPPKFIIIEYRGAGKEQPPVVLVGKALTFDSGGISLKPAEKMDEMKTDMAGGAAVIGAVSAAAELHLPVNIVGLIPATENLPGGRACKPGDILKSMSGKTIEVINTDAEGRLILADALAYAGRFKPAAIIDIATLTGACIVALGDHVMGMVGTDENLKTRIKKASEQTGELLWELPLWENYQDLVKSDIADYKNSTGRPGGAITAAAFLSKFVGPYPWVHLDIAGPAWLAKDQAYNPKGASGVGVRLFVQLLTNWSDVD
jgi:leucyl aminopeptidase